jgi:tetratricopeptide (TPR) repeat protein
VIRRYLIRAVLFVLLALACSGCGVIDRVTRMTRPAGVADGRKRLAAGDEPGAVSLFDRAIKQRPGDGLIYAMVAQGCAEAGVPALAATYAERGLKATPGAPAEVHAQLYGLLGSARLEMGRVQESLEANRAALLLAPDSPGLMNNLAYSMVELPNNEDYLAEAESLAAEAVSRAQAGAAQPSEMGVYLDTLGWIQFHRGSVDRAAVILAQAADLAPSQAEILYHLARVYQAAGRSEEAITVLRRALKLRPGLERARRALDELVLYAEPERPLRTTGQDARMGREPRQ